jgi:XTP/dITP diphosphohydrolase
VNRRLVLATRNPDKLREIQAKLVSTHLEILSLAEFSFVREVHEDRPDLLGNAIKKACQVAEDVHEWVLADDTGLEVDALNGAPGVLSARYSGSNATYESNCRKLLAELESVPDDKRQARFRTVICLRTLDSLHCVEGVLEGRIIREYRGSQGFGYDPIFELPSGKTLSEIALEEKNLISHRGQAIEKIRALLEFLISPNSR